MSRISLIIFLVLCKSILFTSCSDSTSSSKYSGFMIALVEGDDRGSLYFINDELTEKHFILHSEIDIVDLLWSSKGNLYGVTGIEWYHGYQSFNQFDFKEKIITEIFTDNEIVSPILSSDNSKIAYFKNESDTWKYIVRDINSNEISVFTRNRSETFLFPVCWQSENIFYQDFNGSIYSFNLETNNIDLFLTIQNETFSSFIQSIDNSKIIIHKNYENSKKEKLILVDLILNDTTSIFEDTLEINNVTWLNDDNRIIFTTNLHDAYTSDYKINILDIYSGTIQSFQDSIVFFNPLSAHPNKNKIYGFSRRNSYWGKMLALDLDTFNYSDIEFLFLDGGNPQKVPISKTEIVLEK